ncbi:MAG: hypothetical protein NTX51_14740 [Verrucomicrobia bacterium]|nr:hypothetical protein [Verrucomicrobiota bacterium]
MTADEMLSEPVVVYRKDGRRLLGRSREALGRMMHLGFSFRLTGDKRYAVRAMAEMKAMAAMPDWNPSHFLDTAEMTLAMAVGYDWLYAQLSPDLRQASREAIETKGLGPYLKPGSGHGWAHGGNNWNQVCHAGMVAGALALLEVNPVEPGLPCRDGRGGPGVARSQSGSGGGRGPARNRGPAFCHEGL